MRPFLTRGYVTEVKKRFIVGAAMMRNYDVDTFVICRPRTIKVHSRSACLCFVKLIIYLIMTLRDPYFVF